MSNKFKNLRIVDNFYQTSSFFPMPTMVITTLFDNSMTSMGSYSLCFPYYIAGKNYYAMLLCCRNNSNIGIHLLQNGKCAINFIPDNPRFFKEAVRLGYPGDTPEEKIKGTIFTLTDGLLAEEDPQNIYPKIIEESFQVFECSWVSELEGADADVVQENYKPPYRNFNGITSKFGVHFILKIDRILIKPKYHDAVINGAKKSNFPSIPVDYGYRDNMNFWYTQFRRPRFEPIPKEKGLDLNIVMHAADRIDDKIKFTEEACLKLVKVPQIFLNTVLTSCITWARDNGVSLITPEHMDKINDKRSKEKMRAKV